MPPTRTYASQVARGLEQAHRSADQRVVQLDEVRAVSFSDHHRGRGDGADEFERCEPIYSAALGWYFEYGYELWLLGDVEELWENRPDAVVNRYADVLGLERQFGPARLTRLFGDHDLDWSSERQVAEHLAPSLPPGVRVHEALVVQIMDGDRRLGSVFLAHGHQGSPGVGSSLWRTIGRAIFRAWFAGSAVHTAGASPATNALVRARHDAAVAEWAGRQRDPLILVAGHTHRPVFPGAPPRAPEDVLADAERRYEAAQAIDDDLAGARAELEYARAVYRRDPARPIAQPTPAYFNPGACSNADGKITGLTIDGGRIELVRWPDNDGRPRPEVLATADLRDIFARLEQPADAGPSGGG